MDRWFSLTKVPDKKFILITVCAEFRSLLLVYWRKPYLIEMFLH